MYAAGRLAAFDRALETYLEANRSRNLPLLEKTTSSTDDVCMMLPTGARITGRAASLQAKKQWFAQSQWRLAAQVIWTIELGDTAVAVIDVLYSDADARGLPRDKRYRQLLVFRKDVGEWKAVAELA